MNKIMVRIIVILNLVVIIFGNIAVIMNKNYVFTTMLVQSK